MTLIADFAMAIQIEYCYKLECCHNKLECCYKYHRVLLVLLLLLLLLQLVLQLVQLQQLLINERRQSDEFNNIDLRCFVLIIFGVS